MQRARLSNAPRLASSSAALFTGRNECPENHFTLIKQEEREDSSCQREIEVKRKMEERTGWQGQRKSQRGREEKRSGRLVGASETSNELVKWRRLQQKNLSILVLLKRKGWLQCHRESSWQVRQSRLSKASDCKVGKSQAEREPHFFDRGSIRSATWKRKTGLHRVVGQVPRW